LKGRQQALLRDQPRLLLKGRQQALLRDQPRLLLKGRQQALLRDQPRLLLKGRQQALLRALMSEGNHRQELESVKSQDSNFYSCTLQM
jgi:hypothetical protein